MLARILYVNHVGQVGGAEVVLLSLVGGLDRRRFEPLAVCPANGSLGHRLSQLGAPVHPHPVPRLRRGWSALYQAARVSAFRRWLDERLRECRVDLVHANSFSAQLAAGAAAQDTGLPVVWHMHSILKRRWPNGAALRYAARNADRIICVSRCVAHELEAWGVPADKLRVIYNGVDVTSRFQPQPATGYLHAHYGLPRDAQLVINLGQLTPAKGQEVFLRAAAGVARDHANAVFLIVGAPLFGDTAWPQRLQRLAADLGLRERTVFTGAREDVPLLLAEASLVVHSSVGADSLPTVLLEAGAMAKPAVATASGGAPEIVHDGRTGLIVPPGDAEAMAAAMHRLLSDPDLAAAMGAAARRRVEERFAVERFASEVEDVYRELLALAPDGDTA